MDTDVVSVARWQFWMTWKLAREAHLPRLTTEMCLWLPHSDSWTVHLGADGRWLPDWSEPEPVDPPPPSIAWLTWHVSWWWSAALAVVRGEQPSPRTAVSWPGTAAATVSNLHDLAAAWTEATANLTPEASEAPTSFPWPTPRPLIYTVAWVNIELMKNVAEIGEIANMFTHQDLRT